MAQDLKNFLKSKGLRTTQARVQLYELLHKSAKALSPKEIFDSLEKRVDNVDLVSIYRNLAIFEDLKLVHKLRDGRYQSCRLEDDHHGHIHVLFHCTECSTVAELSHEGSELCKAIEQIRKKASMAQSFEQFTLSGLCQTCSKK